MTRFIAHSLFVLAAWTAVIKYLFPIAWSAHYGQPLTTHVYVDFWPLVHVWLGWSLLRWQRYTFEFALGVSIVEIAIIVTKFVLFLSAPQWDIWRTNWFINKLFVLACFVILLTHLVTSANAIRGKGGTVEGRDRDAS